jgi:hypothetical protein
MEMALWNRIDNTMVVQEEVHKKNKIKPDIDSNVH